MFPARFKARLSFPKRTLSVAVPSTTLAAIGTPDSVSDMHTPQRILTVLALAAFVAGCATQRTAYVPTPSPSHGNGTYKVGKAYQIGDTWYYPKEQPDYDETGIASWYGPSFYGHATANGEIYNAGDITAAHRTLPMP